MNWAQIDYQVTTQKTIKSRPIQLLHQWSKGLPSWRSSQWPKKANKSNNYSSERGFFSYKWNNIPSYWQVENLFIPKAFKSCKDSTFSLWRQTTTASSLYYPLSRIKHPFWLRKSLLSHLLWSNSFKFIKKTQTSQLDWDLSHDPPSSTN